jgi:hypothetical protein
MVNKKTNHDKKKGCTLEKEMPYKTLIKTDERYRV